MATDRAMAITAMRRAPMTTTPPLTMVDTPRRTTVTDIEECTVPPKPTTAAPAIMAAGLAIRGLPPGGDQREGPPGPTTPPPRVHYSQGPRRLGGGTILDDPRGIGG